MSKKQTTRAEAMPIRSTSQVKEDDSKIIFANLIKPWMVVSWMEKDFGIDAIIEITKPIASSKDQIVTGKRISVQLKSSTQAKFDKQTFSLSIKKEKINYWMQSFEPVLIVYIDLNTSVAYYRWIDEDLIQELFNNNGDWIAQESVSIKFDTSLQVNKKSLNDIEKYALSWKRSSRTLISSGSYFNYSNEAYEYAKKLKDLCSKYNVSSLRNEVEELTQSISSPIYTISIIGLSRAGKSTLINALLEQNISPVGRFPTTGIPITILPRDENKIFITLKDNNKIIEGNISSEFLAEYSTQDKNPKNEKGVKYIRVHLTNNLLEKGFALCDVPGLDDADPEIKNISKTAIFNSNAIIYVISLAGYSDGEFRINDKNVEDLNELRGKMDRVFLVFNKADRLNNDELNEVKEYIERTLKQFDISNFLAAPPIFISSQEAFERRTKKQYGTDSVSQLEQIIWEYLINQNKTGFRKLMSNFANEIELIKRLINISKIRLENSDQRKTLEKEIHQVTNAIEQLNIFISNKRQAIYSEVNRYVIDRFDNVINHLNMELNGRVNQDALPTPEQVSVYLEDEAYKILSDVYEFIQRESYFLQGEVNNWVTHQLKQVEFSLDGINDRQDLILTEITQYTGQVYSFFVANNVTHTGVFESIITTVGQAIENLLDKIVNFFTDDQKLLQRNISKMLKNSRASYNTIQTQLLHNTSDYLNRLCVSIFEKTKERTKVYLGELNKETHKLDTPLSNFERENHIRFINELESIETEINSQLNHLSVDIECVDFLK